MFKSGRKSWQYNGQATQTDDQGLDFLSLQQGHLKINWHQSGGNGHNSGLYTCTCSEEKIGDGSSKEAERSWQAGRAQRNLANGSDEEGL